MVVLDRGKPDLLAEVCVRSKAKKGVAYGWGRNSTLAPEQPFEQHAEKVGNEPNLILGCSAANNRSNLPAKLAIPQTGKAQTLQSSRPCARLAWNWIAWTAFAIRSSRRKRWGGYSESQTRPVKLNDG